MMRFNLLGCCALSVGLLAATNSNAADITFPSHDWTGIYGGIQGGYAIGTDRFSEPLGSPTHETDPASFNGLLGGVTIGANKQINKIVFGFEGDISGGKISPFSPMQTEGIHLPGM